MKSTVLVLVALLCIAPMLIAKEVENTKPFSIELGPQAALGLTAFTAGGEVNLLYGSKLLKAQAGARFDYQTASGDMYFSPFAGLRLWIFNLAAGITLKAKDAPAPEDNTEISSNEVLPYGKIGVGIPIGHCLLDLSMIALATDTYIATEEGLRGFFAAIFAGTSLYVAGAFKANLSLRYVF